MGELCQQLEWNFLKAASSYSSFSGLATSMVLASMVIVVVQYKGEENTSGALALFTITLLALGTDTFIFGSANGDAVCARAGTQGMLGSSTLGVGVVILLAGIGSLQAKFKKSLSELALIGSVVTGIGAIGVMGLLALWSVRFVNGAVQLQLRPGPPMSYMPALVLIGVFTVIVVIIAALGPRPAIRQRAIVFGTGIYLLHIVAVVIMYLVTMVVPLEHWTVQASAAVMALTLITTIGFPFIELTAIVLSLDWRSGRGLWRRLAAAAQSDDEAADEENPAIPEPSQPPKAELQGTQVASGSNGGFSPGASGGGVDAAGGGGV